MHTSFMLSPNLKSIHNSSSPADDDKYDDEESDNDDKEADHDVPGSTCTQALCYLLISSPCMIHTSRGL